MTNKSVIFPNADHSISQSGEASDQDDLAILLREWVIARLADGVQELDTMIVTAPDSLKSGFCCYDVMADEIEMVIQRIWTDIARQRMRSGHRL